jgi:hypothetical protein
VSYHLSCVCHFSAHAAGHPKRDGCCHDGAGGRTSKHTSSPARSRCRAARARCARKHHKAPIAQLGAASWCALTHARLATSSSPLLQQVSKALLRRAPRPPAASRTPARLQSVMTARHDVQRGGRRAQRAQQPAAPARTPTHERRARCAAHSAPPLRLSCRIDSRTSWRCGATCVAAARRVRCAQQPAAPAPRTLARQRTHCAAHSAPPLRQQRGRDFRTS